ncbi:predicted protein [Candida tropicalis MYA-3404]|uniref:Uncharacterized protein n=1 Tax=Candida tropicalis (strain ATCC MYA-3404 / T1) TaxID=294747 RepID=C5MEL3_CANTT|nr:predicted protein [Candida tropicalis MYA-3404]EER31722.1 predicted protein [Candida tropicalis MYA-3404]KAG4405302.1 hypothetical protein JTP64_005338 [Candida tropicalis]
MKTLFGNCGKVCISTAEICSFFFKFSRCRNVHSLIWWNHRNHFFTLIVFRTNSHRDCSVERAGPKFRRSFFRCTGGSIAQTICNGDWIIGCTNRRHNNSLNTTDSRIHTRCLCHCNPSCYCSCCDFIDGRCSLIIAYTIRITVPFRSSLPSWSSGNNNF